MDSLANPQVPQKKENKGLAFLEIGLVEFGFVAVVLLLLFGTLNYFNILPISQIWPNQLGFLPHKEVSTGTSPQRIVTSPSVSLTDTAKQTLNNYLPTILVPSLLPRSSDISFVQNEGVKESFTVSLNTKAGTISAFAIFYADGKNISQIYASILKPETKIPSLNTTSTTVSSIFSIKPKGKWACRALESPTIHCENFWEETNGVKRGIGVQGIFTRKYGAGPPTVVSIFFCEHTKDSPLYPWKSCEFEFAQTGVQ